MKKAFKKIIIVVLGISLLMLSACGSKGLKQGKYLYEELKTTYEIFATLKDNLPSEIDIFPVDGAAGQTVSDPETVKQIVGAFTNIKVGKEVPPPNGIPVQVTFYWEEGNGFSSGASVVTAAENVEYWDADGNQIYYQLENAEEYVSIINKYLSFIPKPDVFQDVYEYQDFKVSVGQLQTTGGEASVSINFENNSDTSYICRMLDLRVNGFYVGPCLELGAMADNEITINTDLGSTMLSTYGINNINEASFVLDIYSMDTETYDCADHIATTDEILVKSIDVLTPDKDVSTDGAEVIYDKNNVQIYSKIYEDVYNSDICLYIKNGSDSDAEIACNGISINGTEQNIEGLASYYYFKVVDGCEGFADFPVSNYVIDETTYETEKIELTDLTVDFSIMVGGKAENITVKLK